MSGSPFVLLGIALAFTAGVAAEEAKALDDGELTAGSFIARSFRADVSTPSEVYCGRWDGVATQLCTDGAASGPTLVSAFQAGGSSARNALAALIWGSCSDPTAFRNAWGAFFNSSAASDSTQVLPIAENYVQAAGELGVAACATVVTLDGNQDLLDSEIFHSGSSPGGSSDSPSPSPGGSSGGPSPSPGGSSGSPSPSPGGGSSDGPLPSGKDFAQDMCDASKAAEAILDALRSGGGRVRVAVAALLSDACNNQTATNAALQAFTSSEEMNDPSTVLNFISSFVDACDAVGLGCCFTVVVLDPSTDAVLDTVKVHTSGGGGSPAPAQPPPAEAPSNPLPPSDGGATLEQCQTQLGTATSGCTGATIAPGSPCCNAVLALCSECLSLLAAAASQPGADQATVVAVTSLLSGCGTFSGGPSPTPAPSSPSPVLPPAGGACEGDALAQFQSALGSCDASSLSPGTSCCDGIQALGGACLNEVLATAASNATLSYLIADAGAPSGELPNGIARLYFSLGMPSTCYTYSPLVADFVNMTVPTHWNASGDLPPSDSDMTSAMEQLCQGSSAGTALVQAVAQGGATAKAWIAGWYFTNSPAASYAAQEFIKALSSQEPDTALTYARNWVDACQGMGLGSCVTVASLSSSGAVLGEVQLHTDVPVSRFATAQRSMAPLHLKLHAPPT
ncbi:hypothetical protein ABPG75_004511 [Micractinium tetrahymenae]